MSNTLEHAEREFELMEKRWDGTPDNEPLVLEFKDEILAVIRKFGESGQSGGSAPYVSRVISDSIQKLCMFMPLSDIEDNEEDWKNVSEMMGGENTWYQHKRLSSVFKKNGKCDYLEAVIFRGEEDYDTFSGRVEDVTSSLAIKNFPFRPKTFYIDVTRELNTTDPDRVSCGSGDYLYKIKDRNQLKEVFEYYDPRED